MNTRTFRFTSLTAFYAVNDKNDAEHRPAAWIGADPAEIAARRFTWPEGVAQLNQLPELHQHRAHTKRAKRWSEDDGDTMDMERYHDGRPFLRQRYRAETGTKAGGRVQRIRINTAEGANTKAAAMLWKSYAAARIIDALESRGTRCEVVIVCSTRNAYTAGARNYHAEITIKRPAQPLNLAAITTAAAPWMLRRHILDHIRAQPDDKGTGGAPRPMPTDPAALDIETGECLSKASAERWIKSQTI